MTTVDKDNPHYVGEFGDERLAAVGADLVRALEEKRTVVVKRLGGTRAEEIRYGRFLKNDNVMRYIKKFLMLKVGASASVRRVGMFLRFKIRLR